MNPKNIFQTTKNWGGLLLAASFLFLLLSFVLYVLFWDSIEGWTFLSLLVHSIFGILPAGIVFYMSEKLTKIFLNLFNEKISRVYAVLIGLGVGILLIGFTNLLLWSELHQRIPRFTFVDFLFPKNTDLNPYFLPSIFNFVFSGYIGWKFNKFKSQ